MNQVQPMLLPRLLQFRLLLTRLGCIKVISITALVLGAGGGGWLLYHLQRQLNESRFSLLQSEQPLRNEPTNTAASEPSTPKQALTSFYSALGDSHHPEQQIKILFSAASKVGIVLEKAEYRASFDKLNHITAYRVIVPVRGSYMAIRQFCEQILLRVPFASLDDMKFKRDSISNSTFEGQLQFTFFLGDGNTPAQQSARTVANEDSVQ